VVAASGGILQVPSVRAALNPASTKKQYHEIAEGSSVIEVLGVVHEGLARAPGTRVFLNGAPVPRERWAEVALKESDTILIRVVPAEVGEDPEDDKVLRSVLMIGVSILGLVLPGVWGAVVGIGGYFAVDALVPVPQLEADTPSGAAEPARIERTPALSGARNSLSPYGPIPIILGKHRVTPPLGAQPYTELDQSDQFLRMLMIPGYGLLEMIDPKIGETPITDYSEVEMEMRTGGADADPLTLFPSTVTEENPNVLLKQTTDWVTRRTQEDIDEIGVELTFPRGLVYLASDGTKQERQVLIDAEYREVGGSTWKVMDESLDVPEITFSALSFVTNEGWWQIVISRRSGRVWAFPRGTFLSGFESALTSPEWYNIAIVQTTGPFATLQLVITDIRDPALTKYGAGDFQPTNSPSIFFVKVAAGKLDVTGLSETGRTTSVIRKGVAIRVERDQYDVRIRRATADSEDANVLDEVYWTALRSIINEDPVNFDDVAKIALRIKATDQLQGVVEQFNVLCHSIIKDWDSATSAWVERATSNPASIFRHLLQGSMNRRPVADSRVDLETLQTWHEWCEANGHEFNGVINYSTTLLQLLRDVAAVGRASPTMRDGLFSVVQDVEQTTPRQLFTPKNSWGFGASRSFAAVPHALKIQFVNGLPTQTVEVTPANVEIGDVFKINFGTATLASFTATAATIVNVTAGLKAAWDASTERVASFYDATDEGTHVLLTSNRPSAQYDLLGETTDGGGNDTQTLVVETTSDEPSWERDEIVVYDDGFDESNATLFEEVSLLGVANADQAWKVGRYHLAVARLRPEVYTLSVDVEHLVCNRGDLVRVQHDVPLFGLSSGRVTARAESGGNVTTITLDESVAMTIGKSYAVRYRQEDMTIQLEDVDTDVGEQTTLTFSTPVAVADAPAVGDLVSFGEQGSETVEMIVLKIEMRPELTAKLTLVDAAPAVHSADAGAIPEFDPQVTVAPQLEELVPAVPEIVSLRSGEAVMVRHKDGTFENRILATIRGGAAGAVPAARFEAQFKLSDKATWVSLPDATADATEFSVTPVEDGEVYDFRVRAISQWGVPSAWDAAEEHTVLGAMELGTDFLEVYDEALDIEGGEKGNASIDNGVLFVPVDTEETWAEHFSSRGWTDIQDQIDAGYPYYAQPTKPNGGQSNELPDPAESGLAGAWLGAGVQGSGADWSRAADDLTAIGSPTYRPVAGVTLDGLSQYLRRAEAGWNDDDEDGMITALVRVDAIGAAQTIFASADEATDVRYFKLSINASGKLELSQRNNDTADVVEGGTVLVADAWYHVAATVDASGWHLYVDGVEESLTTTSGTNSGEWLADVDDRDNVLVGALRRTTVTDYLDGDVKDVRYYSERRLTDAQVLTLATGGRGAWETEVDLGGTVYYSKIVTSITLDKVDGNVAVTPSLSVSSDGSTWTDYVGSAEINVTGYRYVRVRYDFVAEDDISFVGVSEVRLEIDARTRIDSALVALAAGDSGGTDVSFGIDFLKVVAIVVTPKTTNSWYNEVNFDFDQDNPTTFKVLMFDESGVRQSGDATYVARGY
jgi:sulfur carrier protein ThiS